jgi:nitrate reductase NapE component
VKTKEYSDEEEGNPKFKLLLIGALVTCLLVVGVIGAFGLTSWISNIRWDKTVKQFSVWDSATGGTQLANPLDVDLGTNPPDPYTVTYYIQNDGTLDFQVTCTVTTSDATVSVTPSNPIQVAYNSTRTAVTLTLSNLAFSGSCTVQFAIA